MAMFGFVLGGLAVAWGALVAFLEDPDAARRGRAERACTALLITTGAVTVAGGVAAATAPW